MVATVISRSSRTSGTQDAEAQRLSNFRVFLDRIYRIQIPRAINREIHSNYPVNPVSRSLSYGIQKQLLCVSARGIQPSTSTQTPQGFDQFRGGQGEALTHLEVLDEGPGLSEANPAVE